MQNADALASGEIQNSCLVQDGIPTWYHGAISRESAESLLQKKPVGCFLVRVSESHVGYTLSYRARDCYRHFMIKCLPDGNLVIPGEMEVHPTLVELVSFYQETPLHPYKELLTQPCSQENENEENYEEISPYSNVVVNSKIRSVDSSSAQMSKQISFSSISLKSSRKKLAKMFKANRSHVSSQPGIKPEKPHPAPGHTQRSEKALVNDAPQEIWNNFKKMPQNEKKKVEQVKNHISENNFFLPSSAVPGSPIKNQPRGAPGLVEDESATQVDYSAQNLPSDINIYT
ncbi:hematopoietic SH2 domain-containing protein [Sminthopsis crassicaudata]|uniref:hematopoietic SH2 domain-containing protein n=1 Tax=Sminthopsis crassicaudata TaxID=9301 RepID=UPI003D692885